MQLTGLPGWSLGGVSLDVVNFSAYETPSSAAPTAAAIGRQEALMNGGFLTYPGARMVIEVERTSEAFYIVIVILPIALIVLFSFCMFSLSRDALKVGKLSPKP